MNEIKKTYKNYVGGKYVRSESGKTFRIELKNDFYEVPLTSRKDIRDAVVAAKKGFNDWQKLTPYNKTQVLYRLSEMLEGNFETYQQILQDAGLTKAKASDDIHKALDSLIWYAGMADKWEQMTGNLNPVSGDFFNISHQEALGVVFTLNSNEQSLNKLLLNMLPALTTGCSVISFNEDNSILALKLAEDINNSDLPGGALNIMSGKFELLIDDVSNHVEITAMAIYKEITIKASDILPQVTWGTSPQDVAPINGKIPDPAKIKDINRRNAVQRSLDYMGLEPNQNIRDIKIDKVFIGSCTNGRIEDLREVARVVEGKKITVDSMVVPGSGLVKEQAEKEGLDKILIEAGFDWREPGCSMCLAMNPDQLKPKERCASTSNRNFEGRQGREGRTHLVSPVVAAASAIRGTLSLVEDL